MSHEQSEDANEDEEDDEDCEMWNRFCQKSKFLKHVYF